MTTLVGTSGWSYKEWKGSFYPPKLPADEMLRYYAERFDAVEVNNSFYRMPSERILAGWAEQVPDRFRFVMKASRRITHNQRLRNEDESLSIFLRAVNPLGHRLGPTLFQLPPTFKVDVQRLREFWTCFRDAGARLSNFATPPGSSRRSTTCSTLGTCPWSRWTRTPSMELERHWSAPQRGDTCDSGGPATPPLSWSPGHSGSGRSPGLTPTFSSNTKKAVRQGRPPRRNSERS